ncbi:MAG: ISAzo13-like element transposase-related protein [Deltaproteobacteria bacterium]
MRTGYATGAIRRSFSSNRPPPVPPRSSWWTNACSVPNPGSSWDSLLGSIKDTSLRGDDDVIPDPRSGRDEATDRSVGVRVPHEPGGCWVAVAQDFIDARPSGEGRGRPSTTANAPPSISTEHRLFSFISMNWRGKPLTTYRTVVELIAATTTRTGLKVQPDLDAGYYPIGVKITDAELDAVPLQRHDWHPDWNYSILPP